MDEFGKDSSKNRGAITILNKGSIGWEERVREEERTFFSENVILINIKYFFKNNKMAHEILPYDLSGNFCNFENKNRFLKPKNSIFYYLRGIILECATILRIRSSGLCELFAFSLCL
jgi:hypothetical protein